MEEKVELRQSQFSLAVGSSKKTKILTLTGMAMPARYQSAQFGNLLQSLCNAGCKLTISFNWTEVGRFYRKLELTIKKSRHFRRRDVMGNTRENRD